MSFQKYCAFATLFLYFLNVCNCQPMKHISDPSPSEAFPYHAQLDPDGNFYLYWKFNATHITFETHVRTKGYVGFGFSPNGNMYPSDVIVGWVKNGVSHFQDRHAIGHSAPVIDASQDWSLLHGEENNFGTVLKMVRKLETCDKDDMRITNDTIRAIYSFNPYDPIDENIIPYHGSTRRGAKSLMLLTQTTYPPIPHDALVKDFLNDNYHVPSNDTTYACRIFSLADIKTKHHIIKFEPVVEKGHESLIHHVVMLKCPSVPTSSIGFEYTCYEAKQNLRPCGKMFAVWAVGGQPFYYPDDAGMPIGEPGDTDVFIMETHYNNPGLRDDFIDSSGMRFTLTPTLRTHDAGLLLAGVSVTPLQIIPPHMEDFRSIGFCSEECLRKGLSKFPTGVNVFAVFQHAHLLSRGIRTRLYRHGTEQEPLAYDENYDFNYQDFRYLRKRRTLQQGDTIVTECRYNSTGRSDVTRGGFSTRDEMCESFVFYYPRMDVDVCESYPSFDKISSNITEAAQILWRLDWKNASDVKMYLDKLNSSQYWNTCLGRRFTPRFSQTKHYLPRPSIEYVEPSTCPGYAEQTIGSVNTVPLLNPKASSNPTEVFPFKATLDSQGSYELYWKVNTTHITFEVHVRTHGYVGFGLSPNGNMYPADVVIGWVKDGKSYFKDRYTVAHSEPLIDNSQDWFLLHAEENEFGTVLKMVRKLDTCDSNDFKITEATVRIIYSYHPDDPQSETVLPYHGNTRRGAHSLLLLAKMAEVKMPSDVITRDLLNDKFHVPAVSTFYNCRVYDVSDLGKKHYLVRMEPVIQKGSENIVHHIVVYRCPGIDKAYVGRSYNCEKPPVNSLYPCNVFYLAWSVGGQTFILPENVGLPFADPLDPSLLIIETHYNNPGLESGHVDSSGLRLYLTPTPRRYEAGVLTVEVNVSPAQVIPPFEQSFISSAFCTEECLNKGLSKHPDGVHVFAILQHAHLLARGIKTRLIRKGVEQEPLTDDKHYDFDYQDIRLINKHKTIKAGDTIIVECTYDSTNRTSPTYGGLSTTDEMCLSFIYYYPKMTVETCESTPLYDDMNITHGHMVQATSRYNWADPKVREKFKESLALTNYTNTCIGRKLIPMNQEEKVQIPVSRYPYIPPKSVCDL